MRLILASLCIALSLAACATTTPPPGIAVGESVLLLNVEGGKFEEFRSMTVGTPIEQTVDLAIERVNPDPRWLPLASVCARSADFEHSTCVHLSALYKGSSDLMLTRKLYQDRGATMLLREPLPGKYSLGEPVTIGLRSGPNMIELKVGKNPWQMHSLPFTPETVYLICSSALCMLRMH